MSLPKDMIALPREVGTPSQEFKKNHFLEWHRINYPSCMEHKEYPRCNYCAQKYVPIEKDDVLCFKCKMTR